MKKKLIKENVLYALDPLKPKKDNYFCKPFEDVRQKRSLRLVLSLPDEAISKPTSFTDYEITIMKNLAVEKLHRQRVLKIFTRYNS